MTKTTRRTAVMSSMGLPSTATKSASKPGATVPIRLPRPSDSAAIEVELTIASIGVAAVHAGDRVGAEDHLDVMRAGLPKDGGRRLQGFLQRLKSGLGKAPART